MKFEINKFTAKIICEGQVTDAVIDSVARENELVAKRNENPAESYFDCHTDITIPYDELGELSVVKTDGTSIPLILDGRFVLPGCEDLNKPFDGEEF